jgi:NAD(P)-dependent dehydrogenase (short-subunit alcohol dehydrogenase family)
LEAHSHNLKLTLIVIFNFQELKSLADANPDKLKILQIDLKNFDKYGDLAKDVEDVVKAEGLNVLFNSAGISPRSSFLGLRALKANELMDAYAVNCVAPLMLSKAFHPLLKRASKANATDPLGVSRAVIVNMSSILGSIASNAEGSLYHYRVTKSGLNAATKSLSIDMKGDGIMAISMHPGWVKTDMGGDKAPMEVVDSCRSMAKTIFNLKPENNGGFMQYDGKPLPW